MGVKQSRLHVEAWDRVKIPVGQKPHGQKPHGQKPHGQKPHGQKPHGQKPGWSKAPNKHLNFKTNLLDIYTCNISESLPSDAVSNAFSVCISDFSSL